MIKQLLGYAAAATMLATTAAAQSTSGPNLAGVAPPSPTAAAFKDSSGRTVGQASLYEGATGVLIRLDLHGLPAGWHGLHFHAVGDCSDMKFEKAGAHVNALPKRAHGLLNAAGPDFGDLPNVYVGPDGTARAEVFSSLVSLAGVPGRPALKDTDGSALMIHVNADDQTTQPIGGAGARLACAVIR